MMATSETVASLHELNEGLAKLRMSTRRSVPMFLVGVLATLVAAGVAIYYILTLSADLREARIALEQSQAALRAANSNLGYVGRALRKAQEKAGTSAEAKSIATAISDVNQSQASISSASNSISDAALKISTPEVSKKQMAKTAPLPKPPAPAGTFEVRITSDRFLSLRAEPSMVSSELAKIPSGSKLECKDAIRNVAGNWWRPCQDSEGRSGYVSDKFIRRL